MSYYLFLDDQRNPKDVTWVVLPENVEWVIARDFSEFQKIIHDKGIPKFASFDCDLHEEHYVYANKIEFLIRVANGTFVKKTGIDCAKLLRDFCLMKKVPIPEFRVHSMNMVGGTAIRNILTNHSGVLE